MRRLRVALVAPSLRILGGQAVQADRLLRGWEDDRDVSAWLVPVNPAPRGLRRSLARIKYLRTILNEDAYLRLLVRELRHADVVHIFSASYTSFLLAPLPAIIVAKRLGKPVVLNYRSGEAPDHLRRSAIARRAIASANLNVVPSRFLADVLDGIGVRATIIPNVVELDRFRFRQRVPLGPRLVSTRNLEALYNVPCTLRAFRIVQDRWPHASLTLVGGGREERTLRTLASDLKLQHVTFVGKVAPGDVASYYAGNDIYVQTPNIDNMPTSIIEAFASGLPVVATEAGGVPAILQHEVQGLLAPLDDHRAVAAQVLRLLDDPALAVRLANAAFASCEACTWSAVRERWLDVYHRASEQAEDRGRAFGWWSHAARRAGAGPVPPEHEHR